MRLKSIIQNMYKINDINLSRPLLESIVAPEVNLALSDWIKNSGSKGVLIGGLAYSYYAKPRATMDVDILFLSNQEIPSYVHGFKKTREYAFLHKKTHVEIEVLEPSFLKISTGLVQKVIQTAVKSNNMNIASKSGLVALKLARGSRKDQGDIEGLIETRGVDITPFLPWLSEKQIQLFKEIDSEVKGNT